MGIISITVFFEALLINGLAFITSFKTKFLITSPKLLKSDTTQLPSYEESLDDPDSQQRQRVYLQALRKYPPQKVKIIEGKIIKSHPTLRFTAIKLGFTQLDS